MVDRLQDLGADPALVASQSSHVSLSRPSGFDPGAIGGITDEELLRRAVANARSSRKYHPRWSAVADAFVLGSTFATRLCRRFGLDPDEQVRRR